MAESLDVTAGGWQRGHRRRAQPTRCSWS